MAALGLVEPFDPVGRVQAAAPLLSDPVRGVRIEAARALADVPESGFPANRLGDHTRAAREYQEAMAINADWPAENVNQGNFLLRQGLALLPKSADLHHALGLALVRQGNASAALPELAAAANLAPDNGRYAYVYAVALHAAGKRREALTILQAAEALPDDPDIKRLLETLAAEKRVP